MLNAIDGPGPAFLEWENAKRARSNELWASFFSQGNPDCLLVKIPLQWIHFFTFLLLSPTNCSWAKDFLASRVSSLLDPESPNINFFLPPTCLSNLPLSYRDSDQQDESSSKQIFQVGDTPLALTPPKKRISRKSTLVVDNMLRRSRRLKEVNNGFKVNSCSNKKCLACYPKPPTLSIQSLQSLCFKICKLNQDDPTEEARMKKSKQSLPIAPRKAKMSSGEKQAENMEEYGQQGPNQNHMVEE